MAISIDMKKMRKRYSDNQKTMEKEDDIIAILKIKIKSTAQGRTQK